jgi:hypothetical protein
MTKRLQVLFDDEELGELRRVARRQRMTVAAWVRLAIRGAVAREETADPARKLEAIRRAARHVHPIGDIDQILAEIERGYLAE